MTRWLPRSLFSRLTLILLAGLIAALLASLIIHLHDRGEMLARAGGMRSAQRIADIVRLLDTITPAERRRITALFNTPPLIVSLDRPALRAGAAGDERAEIFAGILRRALDARWPLTVVIAEPQAGTHFGPGMMRGGDNAGHPGMIPPFMAGPGYFAPPGMSFVVQVQLNDGARVTFDSRLPEETFSWPYRLLATLLIALGSVTLLSLVAVRWVTRPLKTLADAAEELGRDINRAPLPERGPLEVERAARAFNTMQRRLAGFLQSRTRILAAMSHDLKTPITRLRLRAELLDDAQVRGKFVRDLEEMEAMVAGSLDFMRGLEQRETVQPIDVGALLESLQADARETGGAVTIEGTARRPYPGRPQALKRCLGNLIDNAIKYGQSARVRVEDGDDRLLIRVRDSGPGIPQAELTRVFEPFYRVEASRSRDTGGTGLGLTIAQQIAQAHGGELTLVNAEGGGLEAALTLPRGGGRN
ncbi:MAG TPA: ATP-binding protein [Burkholderiales bacterium]|nr:ATP-binding protein [Burkholderiales bacterium]